MFIHSLKICVKLYKYCESNINIFTDGNSSYLMLLKIKLVWTDDVAINI